MSTGDGLPNFDKLISVQCGVLDVRVRHRRRDGVVERNRTSLLVIIRDVEALCLRFRNGILHSSWHVDELCGLTAIQREGDSTVFIHGYRLRSTIPYGNRHTELRGLFLSHRSRLPSFCGGMSKSHREFELQILRIRRHITGDLLGHIQLAQPLVGDLHDGHAGEQVADVGVTEAEDARIGHMLLALLNFEVRDALVNGETTIITSCRCLDVVVECRLVASIYQMQLLGIGHIRPIAYRAALVRNAGLFGGDDVVERRVNLVSSSEPKHRSHDAADATSNLDTVIGCARVGVHAVILHDHLGWGRVDRIPGRSRSLHNPIGSCVQVGEHRSAVKVDLVVFPS